MKKAEMKEFLKDCLRQIELLEEINSGSNRKMNICLQALRYKITKILREY